MILNFLFQRVMALEDEIAEIKICKDKEVADLARQNRVLEARCNAAKEHGEIRLVL